MKQESEYLLQEAKERYPVGTKFMYKGEIRTVSGEPYISVVHKNIHVSTPKNEWIYPSEASNPIIYSNGKWAEIISKPEQPKPFKIEVGGEYQTRDGREVRIYATDGATNFPIHGAIYQYKEWYPDEWTLDGRYSLVEGEFPGDLIPKPKKPLSFTEWVFQNTGFRVKDFVSESINEKAENYIQYLNNFNK